MEQTLNFGVNGMSCASCAGRVERALAAVPGVTVAQVNLASETVRLQFNSPATLSEITASLQTAGYPAREQTVHLAIENMSCASCVGRVERALAAVPGVLEVRVNLASEEAFIRFLEGETDGEALGAVATSAGYPAKIAQAEADTAQSPSTRQEGEARKLTRDMWIALGLTLPVFLLEMGGHMIPALHHWIGQAIGHQNSWYVQFLLTSIVLGWPGRRFYQKGIPALLRAAPDMNSLVALGTFAAYGFSVVATFWPELLPEASRAVYYEAAAVIVVLILLGRALEARAKGKTGAAITSLIGLRPHTALIETEGAVIEQSIAQISVGDILVIKPGARIAVDAQVISGESYVDESMISGEPLPVAKGARDELVGGTVNGTGALRARAIRVGGDTMLAQIIRMVNEAQSAKLPIQSIVDRITMWFVPAILGISVLTIAIWLGFGPEPRIGNALVAGVCVLIIACPCAMGLAVPTSIMVGTGRAAALGVLFRKGDALQALSDVQIVAFDKTGTLTQGRPELSDLQIAPGYERAEVLGAFAAVEALSEHPIARAIVEAALSEGIAAAPVEDFTSVTGYGAQARLNGKQIVVGAARFMQREGIAITALEARADEWACEGKTPIYIAIDGVLAAIAAVADPIKPGSAQAIKALQSKGIRVAMITGDAQGTAEAIAKRLGIHEVISEVLPAGKVAALDQLKQGGAKIAFVGDGINDAPALAGADVGIAIGTGTDVAIESGDVVLMSGALGGVVNALNISDHVMRNIRQNLFWAFGYNAALVPVAAGALYPAFGLLLSPVLGAGAMALSSVFVLSNALRLRYLRSVLAEDGPNHKAP
ncbi:MAG: heavy metal translocating P-type ATPase [Paracoccaceae bacterium]